MIKWVIPKIRADVVVMVILDMMLLDLVLAINHLTSVHEINMHWIQALPASASLGRVGTGSGSHITDHW